MTREIPQFDGREVVRAHNALSGSDEDAPEILHPGDEVMLVVRGTVPNVNHKEDRFTGEMVRVQSIRVTHSMPADADSIARIREEIKRRRDDEVGQTTLDDELDQEDTTDAES